MKPTLSIEPRSSWKAALIAGPCSAETEQQVLATARQLKQTGLELIFRAGIWKPRTRPGSFEGVGEKGLDWLVAVRELTGFRVATEVANSAHVEKCLEKNIDVLWIGARTSVNPFSVQEIADALRGTDVAVLVKNPINPDIQLWIGALERINASGIKNLAAIHRGFQAWNAHPFRNAPMWELVVELKTLCPDLPVLCDPSHICGTGELIPYISQKAIDMDLDGLMIETHCTPHLALSDAKQQLTPSALRMLISNVVKRVSAPPLNGCTDLLTELREKIDRVDEEIIRALSERQMLAAKIGGIKKNKGMTILQVGRWEELMEDRVETGGMMGLEASFIRKVYRLLHEESMKEQAKIMNK